MSGRLRLKDCVKDARLQDALESGDGDVVSYLLRKGAVPQASDLIKVVEQGNAAKVEALLVHSNVDFESVLSQALSSAIRSANVQVVDSLLKHTNGKREIYTDALASCAAIQNIDILKTFIKHGVDLNRPNKAALYFVQDNATATKLLIEHGADPNMPTLALGNTPFHSVCARGALAAAQEMKGADANAVNNEGKTALHMACASCNKDLVKWLITRAGADPRPHCITRAGADARPHCPKTPVLFALLEYPAYWVDHLAELIDLGFDPWQTDVGGDTVLHVAIDDLSKTVDKERRENDEDQVTVTTGDTDLLVSQTGAAILAFIEGILSLDPSLVSARNHDGLTPFHYACESCYTMSFDMVVPALLKRHSDLLAQNKRGLTPLATAVVSHDARITRSILMLLKERDLDIHLADRNGWTPLHWAVFDKIGQIVTLLLEFGANPNTTNKHGRTSLHMTGYPFERSPSRAHDSYGDFDISRVVNTVGFPSWKAPRNDQSEQNLGALTILLERGADATVQDKDGNLPFFLAAASSHTSECFHIIRAAASQGLFERLSASHNSKRGSCPNALVSSKKQKCRETGVI